MLRILICYPNGRTSLSLLFQQANAVVEWLNSCFLFSLFSSVPPGNYGIVSEKLGHERFLPRSLNLQFTYHPLIRRYIFQVTEKVSLNKLETHK
jgi:hypothetical protein